MMLKRTKQADEPTQPKPFRLWPGVVAVMLQWLAMFGLPIVVPGAKLWAMRTTVVVLMWGIRWEIRVQRTVQKPRMITGGAVKAQRGWGRCVSPSRRVGRVRNRPGPSHVG